MPWFGANLLDPEGYGAALASLFIQQVLQPEPDSRVIGFKEIRHIKLKPDVLFAYLDFIRAQFDGAKIIFNRRNHQAAARSTHWKIVSDAVHQKKLAKTENAFKTYAAHHSEDTIIVDYDAYTKDGAALAPLFDFLGEPYDAAIVKEVLGQRLEH